MEKDIMSDEQVSLPNKGEIFENLIRTAIEKVCRVIRGADDSTAQKNNSENELLVKLSPNDVKWETYKVNLSHIRPLLFSGNMEIVAEYLASAVLKAVKTALPVLWRIHNEL